MGLNNSRWFLLSIHDITLFLLSFAFSSSLHPISQNPPLTILLPNSPLFLAFPINPFIPSPVSILFQLVILTPPFFPFSPLLLRSLLLILLLLSFFFSLLVNSLECSTLHSYFCTSSLVTFLACPFIRNPPHTPVDLLFSIDTIVLFSFPLTLLSYSLFHLSLPIPAPLFSFTVLVFSPVPHNPTPCPAPPPPLLLYLSLFSGGQVR
jgi:hypothetical protein